MTVPLNQDEQKRQDFVEKFPTLLEDIYSKQDGFDKASANIIEKLRIIYEENLVTSKIAVIFVSEAKSKFLEKARIAEKLFEELLGFQEVRLYIGLTKS